MFVSEPPESCKNAGNQGQPQQFGRHPPADRQGHFGTFNLMCVRYVAKLANQEGGEAYGAWMEASAETSGKISVLQTK